MNAVLHHLDSLAPTVAVVDSIQSMEFPEQPGGPGAIGQVRECGLALLRWAKARGVPTFVTGHVTKEGSLAGPMALEHMVDVVLHLEGGNLGSYRLLRGDKNRFGSTNEIGVFEMRDGGLTEVPNPSEIALASRGAERRWVGDCAGDGRHKAPAGGDTGADHALVTARAAPCG